MDNKATTKRMIGAVVLVLVAALLLAWLLKGKNRDGQQLASNQTSEISPIKGFPGVGGEEKPSLVGEESADGAAQQQGEGADGAQQQQAAQDDGKGGLIPDVNMPETAKDTTGFDVRPGGEKRPVVDTDGTVQTGEGSMGTGDAEAQKAAGGAAQQQQQVGSAVQDKPAGSGSASQNDAPAEKKPASSGSDRVVLVNERPVPRATSAESAAAEAKRKAEQEAAAAAAKAEAAKKAAAEKAAEAKSVALAGGGAAAGAGGGFSIQVVATSSKAKADSVAGPIAADGYQVAVQPATVGGKTVYRVKVTGYPDRAAAAAAQAKMKSRYTQNQFVQNSFVTSN